jgi:hypothetical protein
MGKYPAACGHIEFRENQSISTTTLMSVAQSGDGRTDEYTQLVKRVTNHITASHGVVRLFAEK